MLLRELRAAHADWQFVVSTTSRTGYELAQKKYADLAVFYCPLDFSWAVRNAMRRIRPSILVLAEFELWPNLIAIAKQHGAKVAIVNGRLSDHSFPGYRRIRPFVARMLRQIDLIAAQNDETAERFLALGVPADVVKSLARSNTMAPKPIATIRARRRFANSPASRTTIQSSSLAARKSPKNKSRSTSFAVCRRSTRASD